MYINRYVEQNLFQKTQIRLDERKQQEEEEQGSIIFISCSLQTAAVVYSRHSLVLF